MLGRASPALPCPLPSRAAAGFVLKLAWFLFPRSYVAGGSGCARSWWLWLARPRPCSSWGEEDAVWQPVPASVVPVGGSVKLLQRFFCALEGREGAVLPVPPSVQGEVEVSSTSLRSGFLELFQGFLQLCSSFSRGVLMF